MLCFLPAHQAFPRRGHFDTIGPRHSTGTPDFPDFSVLRPCRYVTQHGSSPLVGLAPHRSLLMQLIYSVLAKVDLSLAAVSALSFGVLVCKCFLPYEVQVQACHLACKASKVGKLVLWLAPETPGRLVTISLGIRNLPGFCCLS